MHPSSTYYPARPHLSSKETRARPRLSSKETWDGFRLLFQSSAILLCRVGLRDPFQGAQSKLLRGSGYHASSLRLDDVSDRESFIGLVDMHLVY